MSSDLMGRESVHGLWHLSLAFLVVFGAACDTTGDRREAVEPARTMARPAQRRFADRRLQPRQLMRGLVLPHFESIEKLLNEGLFGVEWEQLGTSAALLQEASFILVRHNPVDEAWQHAASGMLRSGSEKILDAVETLDVAAARQAFTQMKLACFTCHKECTADFGRIGSAGTRRLPPGGTVARLGHLPLRHR